jgi:hypothetical protein
MPWNLALRQIHETNFKSWSGAEMCAVKMLLGAKKAHHHLPFTLFLLVLFTLFTPDKTPIDGRSWRVNKLSKPKRENQSNPSRGIRLLCKAPCSTQFRQQ